mgnify:CR=1 FL=1
MFKLTHRIKRTVSRMSKRSTKKDEIPTPFADFDFETQIALVSQRVKIFLETRKKRHVVTIVAGLDPKSVNLKEVASELKRYCATGGTYKDDKKLGPIILLQGNHIEKVKEYLVNHLGIPEENIEVL